MQSGIDGNAPSESNQTLEQYNTLLHVIFISDYSASYFTSISVSGRTRDA